jgi:hypothetical protein
MCSANMYIPRYSPKKSSFLSMYSLDSIWSRKLWGTGT